MKRQGETLRGRPSGNHIQAFPPKAVLPYKMIGETVIHHHPRQTHTLI